MRQRADVLEAHVIPAAGQRARLAAEHEVLRRDAGAERDPLVDEVSSSPSFSAAWRARCPARAASPARRPAPLPVAGTRPGRRPRSAARAAGSAAPSLSGRRRSSSSAVAGWSMMMLAMKRSSCASGSGYVPSSSIRVLRREHVERLGQLIGLALHRDAMLLHRFEQRRLRFRRRAVDLVGKDDVREDRPGA